MSHRLGSSSRSGGRTRIRTMGITIRRSCSEAFIKLISKAETNDHYQAILYMVKDQVKWEGEKALRTNWGILYFWSNRVTWREAKEALFDVKAEKKRLQTKVLVEQKLTTVKVSYIGCDKIVKSFMSKPWMSLRLPCLLN